MICSSLPYISWSAMAFGWSWSWCRYFIGFRPGICTLGTSKAHPIPQFCVCCGFFFTSCPTDFFYPIHHIGFVYSQYLSYSTSADSAVVHFDCQFSGFFRIRISFRGYCVIYAALLTPAALTSQYVVPCLGLVLYLPAFRAFFHASSVLFLIVFYF